jgi:aspartyl-tRNA(Asn)/glutamyl-tRNA(Gln) amidotransferase subunit C
MQINDDLIDRLAELSKLKFEGGDKESIKGDLEKMLDFVARLDAVNTDEVEPLIHLSERTNVLREDNAEVTITKEEALRNAPQKDSDYFKVPRVVK